MTTRVQYAGIDFTFHYQASDLSGLGAIAEICTRNEYLLSSFRDCKDEVFIDIGANIGVATVIMAKLNPDSLIYAFEPYVPAYELLLRNIEANKTTNVKPFNYAITDKNATQNLLVFGTMSGANSLHANAPGFKRAYHAVSEQVVKTCAFDTLLEDNRIKAIRLLKIDCEGSEYEILYNTKYINCIQNIVGEFHNLKDRAEHNGEKLIAYCRTKVKGLVHVSVLDLTNQY